MNRFAAGIQPYTAYLCSEDEYQGIEERQRFVFPALVPFSMNEKEPENACLVTSVIASSSERFDIPYVNHETNRDEIRESRSLKVGMLSAMIKATIQKTLMMPVHEPTASHVLVDICLVPLKRRT